MEQVQGGIRCCCTPTSHFLCADCIPDYVRNELQSDDGSDRRLTERRTLGHCLRCPTDRNSHLPLEATRFYLPEDLQLQLLLAMQADEEHREWVREQERQQSDESLREFCLRSMPNAVQCGNCSYGPIDHFACRNLQTHHGDRHGATQISNACPRCNWFRNSIDEWPRWGGVVDLTFESRRR
ncbi:unnamed protein product [Symbiodinium pilosum]|uniref:Uncharacterized protein n=1 Tax=Symbiodinium pilosum TaxID=2952 RepID=A0A812R3S5_SYMPI|nr:unnamed protein product [Symbiodinium pilosum]